MIEVIVDKINNITFSNRFKILLITKGFSNRKLAQEVGISEQLLSFIILGKRSGRRYRAKIAQVLGTPESEIWYEN